MNLKLLLTIDLPGVSDEKRKAFYKSLEDANLKKVEGLTTTWQAHFSADFLVENAQRRIVEILKSAKRTCKITTVIYAFLVGEPEVQKGQLTVLD
ncbi:hypothetical protein [Alistipes senegalensis]|uniref:hypothetical protein n=1 Tax=Alistipes senegalensis TaxID=1288121 RepID=UPI0018AB5B78|nr:hypothetical protein [Alistipes senegalensis]